MLENAKSGLASLPMEFIEILAENNRKMFAHLNPNDVYSSILDTRFSPTKLPKICLLFIIGYEDNKLKLIASKGIDDRDIQSKNMLMGEGFIEKVVAEGTRQIVYNARKYSEINAENSTSMDHVGTSVYLPLRVVGRVIGVLVFHLEESDPLLKTEQVMLEILAGHAAVAIQNANLYNRTKFNYNDMDFVVQIAHDLASILELNQVLKKILKAAQQIAKTNNSFLWYKDLISKKWKRKFSEHSILAGLILPDIENGQGIIGHVFKTGEPYLCNDVKKDPYYYDTWKDTRSEIASPLMVDGEVRGILNIESPKLNAFTERDLRLLTMLAGEAAIALRNAQLYEIADEKTKQFITLRQINEALGQQRSLKEILSFIAKESLNIVGEGKKICFVMMIDNAKNMLETKAVSGEIAGVNYENFSVDLNQKQSIVGWVARHGERRIANDVSKDPEYLKIIPTTKSEICLPLLFRNEVIGVIDIESSEINAFDEHDVEMLQALADNTAIATKIGELCDIQLRQLKVLYEIGRKITATLNLDEVLNLIANEALAAIGVKDRILYVQLIDQEREFVEAKVAAGEHGSYKNYINKRFHVNEGISGEVIRTGRYFLCADVKANSFYIEINPEIKSELAVPIIFNDQVIGLINIESFKHNDFGQYEVHLSQQLANQAGVAIENARLNEKLADIQFQLTETIANTIVSDVLAGVTHDIRTASTLISGEAQWIELMHEKKQLQPNEVMDSMKKIESNVERIEVMTSNLMQRARSSPPQFVRANLAEITRTAVSLTSAYSRRQKVEFQVEYDTLNFNACVDPLRLHRVFINLIKNAIEAMPNGGVISIRSKRFEGYFDIYFTDQGVGIEKDVQENIWKPFFSSKKGGFGLGLTNCKRIVETDHNGKISMRSVKGKGTKIKVRLPYQQEC